MCSDYGRPTHVAPCIVFAAKVLLAPFPLCKGFDCLPDEAGRDLFSVQAIEFRPFIGKVIGSEDLVDPGKMNSEVFIKTLFLRSVVPVVVPRRHQTFCEPSRARCEIAVRPRSLKCHKNQITQNDGLREGNHERRNDTCAHDYVFEEVTTRPREPVKRRGGMVNGMKTP
jgi:hypothetical protein